MNSSSGRSGSKTMMTNLLLYKSKINRRYRHGWIGVGPTGYVTSERFDQTIRYCLNQDTAFISRDRQVPISISRVKGCPQSAQPPPPVNVRRLEKRVDDARLRRGHSAFLSTHKDGVAELSSALDRFSCPECIRSPHWRVGEWYCADPAGKSAGCK